MGSCSRPAPSDSVPVKSGERWNGTSVCATREPPDDTEPLRKLEISLAEMVERFPNRPHIAIVQAVMRRAGLTEAARFSGRSLRRGGATGHHH